MPTPWFLAVPTQQSFPYTGASLQLHGGSLVCRSFKCLGDVGKPNTDLLMEPAASDDVEQLRKVGAV